MWYEGILPASGTLKKTTQAASMAEHKFKIGERVYFHSRSRREVPPGPCQIIKRLPAANGEFQYVIRSEYKDHQHVAKESELNRY